MIYLDTSAAAKLVLDEPESDALRRWMGSTESVIVSSDLLRTELMRAIRLHVPELIPLGDAVLESITIVSLSRSVYERAATLEPATLRSLDAIHLAVATEAGGDELEAIITYDARMTEGARSLGIEVVAPGSPR